MASLQTIGFIGLGKMGWPMAARLAGGGYRLVVADAAPERAAQFAATFDANAAATPAEVGGSARVIVTMLPTSAIVEAVLKGADGVLSQLAGGSTIIEMSSGAPSQTRKLAGDVAAAGSTLIDAPVSGGVARAEIGSLAIMAGGADESIETARPILERLGSSLTKTGPVGSAHAMKALNNLASAAGLLTAIEVLLIGKKFGIDPAIATDILNNSTGMNNSTKTKIKPFVLSRSFNSGFDLDLMVKDLTNALNLAQETRTSAPLSALCRELWAGAAATLGPGRDHTEITRLAEMLAGTELGNATAQDE